MTSLLAKLSSIFPQKTAISTPGPDFLILGAAKAGTTTLFELLNNLPGFSGSLDKELRFFSMDYFYNQGTDWYHNQFANRPGNLQFEATPHYLYFPSVAERVHRYQLETGKTMKFIVLMREPAARAYSSWNMLRSFHQHRASDIVENHYKYYNSDIKESLSNLLLMKEFPTFQQAVAADLERFHNQDSLLEPSEVRKGLYAEQILHWQKWFDLKQFLFFETSELQDLGKVIKKLERFLNIKIKPDTKLPVRLTSNVGSYKETSLEATKTLESLKEFYRPHNKKLFDILGRQFDWNS